MCLRPSFSRVYCISANDDRCVLGILARKWGFVDGWEVACVPQFPSSPCYLCCANICPTKFPSFLLYEINSVFLIPLPSPLFSGYLVRILLQKSPSFHGSLGAPSFLYCSHLRNSIFSMNFNQALPLCVCSIIHMPFVISLCE